MSVKPNKLVIIANPLDQSSREVVTVAYDPRRTLAQLAVESKISGELTIVKNGLIASEEEMNLPVMPGDIVHVFPTPEDGDLRSLGMLAVAVIAYYYVGPAASTYLQGVGMSAGAAQVWGMVAAAAVVTAGGMLINGNMASPALTIGGSNTDNSPTYGWSVADNTAQEGIAIPVIYGREATYPQIINQWLEVDGEAQWWHVLLSVAMGKTNNVPTAEDIQLGGQPITVLDEDSYIINTTDGSANPDISGIWLKHSELHQMNPINKEMLVAELSQILLHCNGADASTDIVDDGVGTGGDWHIPGSTESVNNWTAVNTAALSTAHPFAGTASLNLETDGDYIDLDNWVAMALWTRDMWDFECRWRQDSLANSAIAGQQWAFGVVDRYYWGIFYNASSGQIIFQQYQKDISTHTIYWNLAVSASLSVDTWYHIRVARSGDTVYLFLDGTLIGSGAYSTAPDFAAGPVLDSGALTVGDIYVIESSEDDHFFSNSQSAIGEYFVADEATVLDANNTVRDVSYGTFGQYVGRSTYYNGSTDTTWYGNCELDEIRLCFDRLFYDLSGFTPPTNPIADAGEQIYITRGQIDSFTVTIQCPYGLYFAQTNGTLDNSAIDMWISYRLVGDTSWNREFAYIWTHSRNPVTRQWTIAPAAGRGQYEIRITRIQWAWELTQSADRFQTTANLVAIDEILHESLSYPYLQLAALSVRAQEKISGRLGPVRITSNRSEIEVPNYNNAGTRLVDPTNNAMTAFDALTNRIYGIGLDPKRIIQSDWEEWVNWCDGDVDGNPRCRLNMAFDANYDLDAALQHIESCGRAKIVRVGSKIKPIVNKPAESVALFCHENITPRTASRPWIRQAERSDAVEITYRDAGQDFIDATVFHPGAGYYALTRNPRVTRLTMLGIKTRDEAMRLAMLMQQISESTLRGAIFQTGLEGLPVMVNDVFDYASKGNLLVFSGRLARGPAREESYTGTVAYLDKEITLDSATFNGDCVMILRQNDDTMLQLTVTGPFDVATWSVYVSASTTFEFIAPFVIGRASDQYQYRVSNIKSNNRKDVRVESLQYVESAYYNPNYGSGSTPI